MGDVSISWLVVLILPIWSSPQFVCVIYFNGVILCVCVCVSKV